MPALRLRTSRHGEFWRGKEHREKNMPISTVSTVSTVSPGIAALAGAASPAPPAAADASGTATPSTATPDVWVAAITAAVQTYVNVGKATGIPSVGEIADVIGKLQIQNAISQSVATSISDFLRTPEAATVVANSVGLSDRAYAYINSHAGSPTPPPQTTTSVTATSGAAAAPMPATAPSPTPTLNGTAQQIIAVAQSTNYVLQKLGKPSISTGPIRGVVRTADSNAGEPGLPSSGVGDALVGIAVAIGAGVLVTGAAAVTGAAILEEVGKEVVADLIVDGVPDAIDAVGDLMSEPTGTIQGETTTDGTGSGSLAPGPDDEGGDGLDGGGGSGEGPDGKPGIQPK